MNGILIPVHNLGMYLNPYNMLRRLAPSVSSPCFHYHRPVFDVSSSKLRLNSEVGTHNGIDIHYVRRPASHNQQLL